MFPVAPYVFGGIQLWRIRRQVLQFDTSVLLCHEFTYGSAAVCRKAVPNHDHRPPDMAHQKRQKGDQLRTFDSSWEQLEVKRPERDPRDCRHSLPAVEGESQHRRLPARRPSPYLVRSLAYPAFVDEDDRTTLFFGFFLMAGHWTFFHSRIAASLRSRARPSGRWQLQPNPRKIFQTCPAW